MAVVDASLARKNEDGALRNVLLLCAGTEVLTGLVDRDELVRGVAGEDCVLRGRAARRRGLGVMVVLEFALLPDVMSGVAGDWRAFAVVVAARGKRAGVVVVGVGVAGESCERCTRRGGGVDLAATLAARRGLRGAGPEPRGFSLTMDMPGRV